MNAVSAPFRCFIDTNVWLDYFIASRRGHAAAVAFIKLALREGVALLYTVATSKDLYFLVEREAKRLLREQHGAALSEQDAHVARDTAWDALLAMRSLACAVGCDEADVELACKHRALHSDYEDDLLIAAALRADAMALVTGDEQLLRHCPVAAMDATDARSWLEAIS